MFNRLYLTEGMSVNIRDVKLEKGSLIQIQPHKTAFIKLQNPKTMYWLFLLFHYYSLENALRHYMVLTKGDQIVVPFNRQEFGINIVVTNFFLILLNNYRNANLKMQCA